MHGRRAGEPDPRCVCASQLTRPSAVVTTAPYTCRAVADPNHWPKDRHKVCFRRKQHGHWHWPEPDPDRREQRPGAITPAPPAGRTDRFRRAGHHRPHHRSANAAGSTGCVCGRTPCRLYPESAKNANQRHTRRWPPLRHRQRKLPWQVMAASFPGLHKREPSGYRDDDHEVSLSTVNVKCRREQGAGSWRVFTLFPGCRVPARPCWRHCCGKIRASTPA